MLKDLKTDNSGIVFVTVIIIVTVAMILAISALSLNISQVKSSENELKYIQAKVLSDGGLGRTIVNSFSATPGTLDVYTETVGNTTFTITSDIDTGGASPPGSDSVPLDISVDF